MSFNEQLYRAAYVNVDNLITNGLPAPNGVIYTTALDFYNEYGKFQSGLEGFFTGSSGNDLVTGSGVEVNGNGGLDVDLYGVDFNISIVDSITVNITPKSLGVGEKDVLVGRNQEDIEDGFFLSALNGTFTNRSNLNNPLTGDSEVLYVGNGNQDFARIKNFNKGKDYVSLSGDVKDYNYQVTKNGDFQIYYNDGNGKGDLVGIVSGGPFDLQPRRFLNDGTFRLSARVTRRGFNEELYLKLNNLENTISPSNALEQYISFGQFNRNIQGVFTGAENGSPVSFSTGVADGNDTLIAYGANNNKTLLSGVGIAVNSGVVTVETGFGSGQIDTLVGGFNTKDDFLLGVGTNLNPTSQAYYIGGGSLDYGIIQNYQTQDRVILANSTRYTFASVGDNFNISTADGDLIGVIEGVSGISSLKTLSNDTIAVKFATV
jgi:hypothetical protein